MYIYCILYKVNLCKITIFKMQKRTLIFVIFNSVILVYLFRIAENFLSIISFQNVFIIKKYLDINIYLHY